MQDLVAWGEARMQPQGGQNATPRVRRSLSCHLNVAMGALDIPPLHQPPQSRR